MSNIDVNYHNEDGEVISDNGEVSYESNAVSALLTQLTEAVSDIDKDKRIAELESHVDWLEDVILEYQLAERGIVLNVKDAPNSNPKNKQRPDETGTVSKDQRITELEEYIDFLDQVIAEYQEAEA